MSRAIASCLPLVGWSPSGPVQSSPVQSSPVPSSPVQPRPVPPCPVRLLLSPRAAVSAVPAQRSTPNTIVSSIHRPRAQATAHHLARTSRVTTTESSQISHGQRSPGPNPAILRQAHRLLCFWKAGQGKARQGKASLAWLSLAKLRFPSGRRLV